jgi:DNA repair protein RadD
MVCPACGYEFPRKDEAKHETKAHSGGILSGETTIDTVEISYITTNIHKKYGADENTPRTVRVSYHANMIKHFSEWLCPEHSGYARRKFQDWWLKNCPGWDIPTNADDCITLCQMGAIRTPKSIKVKQVAGEKFPRIIGYDWPDYPEDAYADEEEPPF